METTNEMVAELESKGYIIKKSISGYYRLIDLYGHILHDDSACEDVHEYDSAVALFYGISKDDFYLCYFDSNCFNDLQYLRNNIYELGARTAKWCGNWDGLKFERFSAKINEEVENKIMDFIQYNGLNIDLNK